MQIDTDLLLVTTSTADELLGGNNIDDLVPHRWPWLFFLRLRLQHTF